MDPSLRRQFNKNFTEEKYAAYMRDVEGLSPGALDFRNAETPIFVSKDFKEKMLAACEEIIDVINAPNFKQVTQRSIPPDRLIPGDDGYCQFMVFDFGVCINEAGNIEPQLIEMQGFPSLFAFQVYHDALTKVYAEVPEGYNSYFNGYNKESYLQLLKDIIIGSTDPASVILLEIFPEKQKTRIDFKCSEMLLGIETVCLTRLKADGDKLYYEKEGQRVHVKKIYNRVIFDDLDQYPDAQVIDLTKKYDVQWIPHPHWFYRVSKFTLPFIDHPFVPDTFFLNELTSPLPLEQYVLKPLFSFAGMGVVIDVTQKDLDNIKDPENWILQKKVNYAPIIETMDEPAKAEIRLFFCWKEGWDRPKAVHNLARLSKGKMIGTRYNKDKTWVGGSIAYFEQ